MIDLDQIGGGFDHRNMTRFLGRSKTNSAIRIDSFSLFPYVGCKNFRMAESERRVVVSNRRARHEYYVLDTFEAGIVLKGTEVKSLRQGNANLQDSYAVLKDGEVWLHNMHISPYEKGNINNHDPVRTRKLLLHKKEIRKLTGNVREKGLTLIPLSVYFSGPHAKVELALAQGKKKHDKREATAKREAEREMRQRMKRSVP